MKTILLKFAGPLQSWGTSSHFETRHTDFHPSKSALIGIIGAGLGYRRDEDEKIQKLNEIDFAVRIDQQGKLLRDYHTAKKYKSNGNFDRTYVTNRYYLEDAVFVVAISHKDEDFIKKIESALKYPYFQPFMGRRALPVCAEYIIKTTDEGAIESLSNCEWKAAEWYKKKNANTSVELEIYADSSLLKQSHKNLRKDRVRSFSQKERRFSYRHESMIKVNIVNKESKINKSEHDIWSNIGD